MFKKFFRFLFLNCKFGKGVKIFEPSNLYGCELKDYVLVGPFVEIQKDVLIGKNSKISSHSFVCSNVHIGEDCFIGHGVMFTNDLFSDSKNMNEWIMRKTRIGDNVRIGSNATILPVEIGDNCIIGAGSVVTKSVPADTTVRGIPAK
tara:strand:+ start:475 stop:915 length:441 start_codon:yes stop_codon:yes gene_type:complete